MKRLLFALLLLASPSWATIYYLDQTGGDDGAAGTSTGTAWKTIGKANSASYSSGDSLLLKRGETWTDAGLTLANMPNNFTIGAYGTGTKPTIDGNVVRPINFTFTPDKTNLTVQNLYLKGEDWQAGSPVAVAYFNGFNGLTIDGVDIDGLDGATNGYQKHGIMLIAPEGATEIKNCTIQRLGSLTIETGPTGLTDTVAISIQNATTGTVSVHDNTIHDIQSDGIQYYLSTVAATIYNNVFYNFGEQGIDLKCGSNALVYNNEFYKEAEFTGTGPSTPRAGIEIVDCPTPSATGSNNRIYNNNFHDIDDTGVHVGAQAVSYPAQNNHVYGNIFTAVGKALVFAGRQSSNRYYYNLIVDPVDYFIYENATMTAAEAGSFVYNNTVVMGTGTATKMAQLFHTYGAAHTVRNNLIVHDSASATDYCFYAPSGTYVNLPTIDHNLCYNPSATTRNYYGTTAYTTVNWATWVASHTGEVSTDPTINADYTLQAGSVAIDGGADVCSLLVAAVDRNARPVCSGGVFVGDGDGPDIGAYEYSNPPIKFSTLTGGDKTLTVTGGSHSISW